MFLLIWLLWLTESVKLHMNYVLTHNHFKVKHMIACDVGLSKTFYTDNAWKLISLRNRNWSNITTCVSVVLDIDTWRILDTPSIWITDSCWIPNTSSIRIYDTCWIPDIPSIWITNTCRTPYTHSIRSIGAT